MAISLVYEFLINSPSPTKANTFESGLAHTSIPPSKAINK